MNSSLGTLCVVLHGHLPYVLNHGVWPHGEAWLYEAAAETYLPLLEVIGNVSANKGRPAFTLGLTPVLLEQLASEHFKAGFVAYLNERMQRARQDHKEFKEKKDAHFASLAGRWEQWYTHWLEVFEHIDRDIPGQFARCLRENHVQLLTSNATHAYLPLLLNDSMIAAQMTCGTQTSAKYFGEKCAGMWLPECAYRPAWEHWHPAVLSDQTRPRIGLETFFAAAGVNHFFVETQSVTESFPLGTLDDGTFTPVSEAQIYWDNKRGWRSPLEPVGVASDYQPPQCFALARHPGVSEQVWSGIIGYPGAPEYLEFHRKHGQRGLRYHRITDNRSPLSDKLPYQPKDVPGKLFEHVTHFCNTVRETLRAHKQTTGRAGVVIAAFDAELFGHWWFEGPQFLRDVMLTLNAAKDVEVLTAQEALMRHPADKVMRLPEGSWGERGNHSVWLNDKTRWMWEVEYRAEDRFLHLLKSLPWRSKPAVKEMLVRAGRELLLLQASDWPFVVHTGGATDYGNERFSLHATRFSRAAAIAESLAQGQALTPIQQAEIDEIDTHDVIFRDIDLNWWL